MNFSEKSCKKCLISWKNTKNHRFGQNLQFFEQTTMSWHFHELLSKKLQKVPHSVEKAREIIDFAKTCNFSNKLPCLGIFMNFSERSCKKCLILWKSTRNHRFNQNLQLFEKTTIYFRFDELYGKKLQKLPHFVKKHEKSSIWPKLSTFRANYHVSAFSWTSQQEVAKSASFRGKSTRNHRFRQNYATFSKKLACLCISINFSGKSCKKWLNSWKRTKYHRFGQNFATFRTTTMSLDFDQLFTEKLQKVPHFVKKHEKSSIWPKLSTFRANYHVSAFSWTSQQEVAKSASFRGKSTRNHRFRQNYATFSNKLPCLCISINFSGKSCKKWLNSWKRTKYHRFGQNFATFRTTTMSLDFDQLFTEKLQKVPHFVKKHEKSSIWPKLSTFRANYHVSAFSWTSQQEVAKSASFRGKSTRNHRFGQNYATFSDKLACLCISINFSGKSCKKWLNSWKRTKYHRFGQNFATFRTTTMSLDFDQLFTEKLQKVPHFVKKHEKSSIWPKLSTFRANYHVSAFSWTSQQEVAKSASFRGKSTRNHRFRQNYATFSKKLACLCISINFSGKSCKKWLNEKGRNIIDLAKTLQLFEQLPCLWISINFSGKSCKKCLIS